MTEPYPGTIENPASQGDRRGCRVCGSRHAGCPSLAYATQYAVMWCPELERALDKAPPRFAQSQRYTKTRSRP